MQWIIIFIAVFLIVLWLQHNDDIKFDKTKKRDSLYDKVKIPLISAILVILIKDLNVKECIDSIQIISFMPKIPNPTLEVPNNFGTPFALNTLSGSESLDQNKILNDIFIGPPDF